MSERELHLMMGNGDKLVVLFNTDQLYKDVSGLANYRHDLTIFQVRDLADNKKGKTVNLINVEGQVDPLAKMKSTTHA